MPPTLLPPVKLEQPKFEFPPTSNGQLPPSLLPSVKLEQNKMSSFDFPPSSHRFYKPLEQLPPSPTNSKSSISVDSPSEGLTSPQPSTIDCGSSVLSPTPINASNLSLPSPLSQTGVLDIIMSSDKCQEFIQYQMHNNNLMFPGYNSPETGETVPQPPPPPPPLIPHPTPLTADSPGIRLPTWEILQVFPLLLRNYHRTDIIVNIPITGNHRPTSVHVSAMGTLFDPLPNAVQE